MKSRFKWLGVAAGLLAATPALSQDNLIANLVARCVGPSTMGGRIADIAVYEKEPRIFYIATSAGGLWKTTNGGITLSPVWDKGSSIALGAVDVSATNPDVVWIGTGEQNGRNSVSYGDGVYKSTNGGKDWTYVGLKETRHIAQLIIDPKNSDIVYVAAVGRLWGRNPERGIYKTTDGGKTWEHVLKLDANTGVNELVMHPSDNRTLIAGAYDRLRFPWNYVGGGPGSALYKSTDAGKTWRKITKGIPEGVIGRIGLDYHRKDPNKMVMQIEAAVLAADGTRTTNNSGVFISDDGGESWTKVNNRNSRGFYFSIPRYDPQDPNRIYIPDVQIGVSDDRGKTIRNFPTSVHVDHHAMWINPNDNNHVIIGQDGGVAQSRDRGATWEHLNSMPIGQFYSVHFDMRKPYWVYGGLQDNGTWGGPTQHARGYTGHWDWHFVRGGDGFYARVDPDDWRTVYSESQGGAAGRTDMVTGQQVSIRPQGVQDRWNWNTPIELSPHNSKIVYIAGSRLYRSFNRGEGMAPISPDLTTNNPEKLRPGRGSVAPENTGAERHCTIVTIGESPLRPGVIWCGTDDGNVQVTQDFGATWTNVAPNMPGAPAFGWVTRVTPSRHAVGRCYVTYGNWRMDDDKTYVYVTEDFGKTWKSINGNLPPMEPCHVIREGLSNPNLLYLGTEFGVWFSFDKGATWSRLRSNFPTVPVHDLQIHPRELDLVIATHGRSIWTMNVSALEELTPANMEKDLHVAKPQTIYIMPRPAGSMGFDGDRGWVAPNSQPGTDICYYLKADQAGEASITLYDSAGESMATLNGPAKAGLNVVRWRVPNNRRLATGDYKVTVKAGTLEQSTSVRAEDIALDLAKEPLALFLKLAWQ
jgi:photosystem II stability/assembly factor-like uncharacterized protein